MSESDEFKPIPYSFALVDMNNKPLIIDKNILAYCPSFYILLDHTIAVIWMLFSLKQEDPLPLGGNQISWALKFLEGMANEVDCCCVDIKKTIKCLQCALVNCISQEHTLKSSGIGIERIQKNDKLMNQESSQTGQVGDELKSVVLNDMLKI